MNSRRTVIIAAALALAALAFFGNVYYLNSAQQRAYKNATLVDVYVVKKPIAKSLDGAAAIDQYLELKKIPQDYRPGSALNKVNINDIKGKVALNALPPGQIIVDGQFVDPKQTITTFAQKIDKDNVAITVSVDSVHGVAGLLVPGDKVDMIVSGKDANDEGTTLSKVMYQNVKILAIGANTAQQVGDSAGTTKTTAAAAPAADTGLITFMVPLDAATRISLVASSASGTSIYLALVPPNQAPTAAIPSYSSKNVLNGVPVTPYPDGQ